MSIFKACHFGTNVIQATVGSIAEALAKTEPAFDPSPGMTTCSALCAQAPSITQGLPDSGCEALADVCL